MSTTTDATIHYYRYAHKNTRTRNDEATVIVIRDYADDSSHIFRNRDGSRHVFYEFGVPRSALVPITRDEALAEAPATVAAVEGDPPYSTWAWSHLR